LINLIDINSIRKKQKQHYLLYYG